VVGEEQQHRLDELYRRWQAQLALARDAQNDATLAEARFKGAVEALGGQEWSWDGAHVAFRPEAPSGEVGIG
jgi:hypothetical protein